MNTFRTRLMFALSLIILVVLSALGLLVGSLVNDINMEQTIERIQNETSLMVSQINELSDSGSIEQYVDQVSDELNLRITVIDETGSVLAESNIEQVSEQDDNYLSREEIVHAEDFTHSAVRISETLNEEMLYYALPLSGEVEGYVRTSLNIDHLREASMQLWLFLGLSFTAAMIIIMILVYRVSQQLTRPIYELTEMSRQLARGNYKARAYDDTSDELGQLARSVNVLAYNLDKMTRRYKRQQDRLEALIDHMGSGLIFINGHGQINLTNKMGMAIYKDQKDYEGLYYEKIAEPTLVAFIQDVFMSEEHQRSQISFTQRSPQQYYEVYGTPITNSHGELQGVVIVLHDITNLKRLEQARKDFVANVSHELKTPVTSLKGFAETLLDGSHEEETIRLQFLHIIEKESSRLQELIEDLLELSRIEHHSFELNVMPLELSEVTNEVVHLLEEKANDKEITIHVSCEGSTKMDGDIARIKQVLINLITNAIVYTQQGGKVCVKTIEKAEEVAIVVQDNGIGIDEESLPRIFERFYRVDRARSRNSGGTGLGLAIVKHLVEAQHGRIDVNSIVGKGTSFTITLPKKPN
ncbi:two-component system histidine kinase PnpS [Geomicrobium sediminis]|uniref:histidine kinase n=1 Tax=Geomicrobium sediminis TaxID=1347788 RepID=A0ABS2P8R9_9BACL|nr:ATP-binding protein [Geomicrobium sediminis]MBM7631803.1 two-component system phosphate regulon sensor histidine kinase PhoR [Geomicrobium sediminis]